MDLLIVSSPTLAQRAIETLGVENWRVVVPSIYSETWSSGGKDLPLALLKQYLSRFEGVFLEDAIRLDSIALIQHSIEALGVKEYTLCDFESINDIADSIHNGTFIDENHANAKKAEYAINSIFSGRLSKAIKQCVINARKEKFEQNYTRVDYNEINRMTRHWQKQLQSFYVLLPTLAGLSWIVKAERNIISFDPANIHRIFIQYQKDGIEFTVPFSSVYTDEFIQERNDAIEHLRDPSIQHRVHSYQNETRDVKPSYKPIVLSFLQSKMFYLHHFSIEYTTKLAKRLYLAGLITNPTTNSYRIPSHSTIELIRYLNFKYGDEYVLQYEREMKLDDDDVGCAIIPMRFEERYDPENVEQTPEFMKINFEDRKMRMDALTVYSFIFGITEWWQMKDAVYDTSMLQIKTDTKKFEVRSNVLALVYDNEKGKNVEQKCWRMVNTDLLDALTANEDAPTEAFRPVIIPKCSVNEVLQPMDVDFHVTTPKRPPRYGVGRFNTQILGGRGIGTAESFHIIQNNMIAANLVTLTSDTMMNPKDIAMETVAWCEQYAPMFLDEKHIQEYWSRINQIRFEGESADQLIAEYNFLIDEILAKAGVEDAPNNITHQQIEYAKSIAIQRNIRIDDKETFFSNPELVRHILDTFAAEDAPEAKKLFKCPICRQGYVYEKEFIITKPETRRMYYGCEHDGCFRIYDDKVDEFFVQRGKNFDQGERLEAITNIASKQHLKKKGYLFHDLIGRNQIPYDAKVVINVFQQNDGKKIYTLKVEI